MSEEIMTSAADLTTMIGLRAENDGLRQQLAQAETQRKAWTELGAKAEADNAALITALTKIADNIESQVGQWTAWRAARYAREMLATDRPGAQILAELEAARAVVEAARYLAAEVSSFPGRGAVVKAVADYDWAAQKARVE